jgi:hypothetical protein
MSVAPRVIASKCLSIQRTKRNSYNTYHLPLLKCFEEVMCFQYGLLVGMNIYWSLSFSRFNTQFSTTLIWISTHVPTQQRQIISIYLCETKKGSLCNTIHPQRWFRIIASNWRNYYHGWSLPQMWCSILGKWKWLTAQNLIYITCKLAFRM